MKRTFKNKLAYPIMLIALLFVAFTPIRVFAEAEAFILSTTSMNLKADQTEGFTIGTEIGAGRIDITSSDETVATVDKEAIFLDKSQSTSGPDEASVTVTAIGVGSATITITTTDFADFDTLESLNGITKTIDVVVEEGTTRPTGPDTLVDPENTDNGESDDESEYLPVPSTASRTPDTGGNTDGDNGGAELFYIFPVTIIGGIIIYSIYFGKNKRRKFEL